MKFFVSLALLTSLIALLAFWGGFTIHLALELAHFGWELVDKIFQGE